jgi:hypothetical protein
MPRFAFKVLLTGGRRNPENIKQVRTWNKKTCEIVVINCGTIERAKKIARKQNDGSFIYLGHYDEFDRIIPPEKTRENLNIDYDAEIAKMHYDDYIRKNRYFIDRWVDAGKQYHNRMLAIVNNQLMKQTKNMLTVDKNG